MSIEKNLTSWKSIISYALGPFWCTGLSHWNVWIITHVHYLSGKPVEINLANFLLKIQLPQQLTLPWYLPGVQLGLAFVSYFPGSFLLRHQETVGGMLSWRTVCSSSWKTLFSPGPLLATVAQSPQVFEVSGAAGKACVRRLGPQSAAVCRCCRSLAVLLQAQPWPWLTPEPGWWCCSRSQALFEPEPQHHLHSVVAPARPSPGPICSCSNPALASLSSCIDQVAGLLPLQLGAIPSDLPASGTASWHLLGNTTGLFSLLFLPFHVQPNSDSELARWGWEWGDRLNKGSSDVLI